MTIPYAMHTGIEKVTEDTFALHRTEAVENHLQTIHAGALYTLAESQSGLHLQLLFPKLEGEVIPLLRDGSMKYRKGVSDGVYAVASVSDASKEKFETMFAKKGRGSIRVDVTLKDDSGDVCAEGVFSWFIQKMEG